MKKKRVRPNTVLKRVVKAVAQVKTMRVLVREDLFTRLNEQHVAAKDLAAAAEEYLAFFDRQAESPKVNAVRHRIQELIRKVRGGG